MLSLIENQIWVIWAVFGIVWLAAAWGTKRALQVQSSGSRWIQACVVFLGLMLIFNFNHWIVRGWLTVRLTPESLPVVLAGAVLTVAGLLFSIWARVVLGKNWSGTVTIKQNHELVRRGPYKIVRHPIYTGILLALVGTALIFGITRAFVGVPVVGLGFWLKLQIEEQFMLQQFGMQYAAYRQQVRALIPFVF